MKILCLVLVLAFFAYSEAAVTSCETCPDAVECAKAKFSSVKQTCSSSSSNDVGCYRQSKSGVLLEAGCANKAMCDAAGGAGNCKTDSNDINTCCCDKNDCNGASFLKMNVLALVAMILASRML